MVLLKVEHISTGYGKKQVLFDVSFEVNKGDIVLLAGSNGSGKSTLLKAIYGLLPQWDNGQILFDGENITGKPASALLKKGLLYIPQKNNVFEDLTVKENLEIAGLTLGRKVAKERVTYVLSMFPQLEPLLKNIPMKLSGGERQLLSMGMTLLHRPKMILMDEPFAGLSSAGIHHVTEKLEELKRNGITLLIVEQRVKECLGIARRAIGLKLGRLFTDLPVNENFSISELSPVFI